MFETSVSFIVQRLSLKLPLVSPPFYLPQESYTLPKSTHSHQNKHHSSMQRLTACCLILVRVDIDEAKLASGNGHLCSKQLINFVVSPMDVGYGDITNKEVNRAAICNAYYCLSLARHASSTFTRVKQKTASLCGEEW